MSETLPMLPAIPTLRYEYTGADGVSLSLIFESTDADAVRSLAVEHFGTFTEVFRLIRTGVPAPTKPIDFLRVQREKD